MLPLSHRTALRALEERIEEEARGYGETYAMLRQLERRINHFLDVYCRRIWQKEQAGNAVAPPASEGQSSVASPLLKSLHRTLVKAYHPDSLPTGESVSDFSVVLMTEISSAYREADLIGLQRAYFHYLLRQAGPVLAHQRAALLDYLHEITQAQKKQQAEYAELLASPEYALMEKAVRAQMRGIDLAEIVSAQQSDSKEPLAN